MRYVISFFILLISSLACAPLYAASLSAEVDRDRLPNNESLRLIVKLNKTADKTIDFSELELQFDIVNTQRSSQTSIVNGKVDSTTRWILILIPKETGNLLIPSFEYDGIYSQAIPITVIESNNLAETDKNNDVFLEITSNKKSLYVQEQLLLTLRLYYKIPLASYDDETLSVDNTSINLVAENTLRTNRNGETYSVLEKIYALHPQASGKLTIPVQSWRLEKAMNRFNFGRSGTPYLYVRSQSIDIDVMPINEASTADTWLPSSALTLDADWQNTQLQARIGEPLTLKVIMIANGLTAAQLPEITLANTNDFTVYSDQATVDDNKSRIGIIGTRVNNFAIIPKKAGTLNFPEIEIKWWNIETDKEQTAKLKATNMVVSQANQQTSSNIALPTLKDQSEIDSSTGMLVFWQLASLVLLITCLCLGYLYIRQQRLLAFNAINATKISDIQESHTLKAIIKDIKKASHKEDLQTIRDLVIAYAKIRFPQQQPKTLDEISVIEPSLKEELSQLNTCLYANQNQDKDFLEPLINKLSALKSAENKKNTTTHLSVFKKI